MAASPMGTEGSLIVMWSFNQVLNGSWNEVSDSSTSGQTLARKVTPVSGRHTSTFSVNPSSLATFTKFLRNIFSNTVSSPKHNPRSAKASSSERSGHVISIAQNMMNADRTMFR